MQNVCNASHSWEGLNFCVYTYKRNLHYLFNKETNINHKFPTEKLLPEILKVILVILQGEKCTIRYSRISNNKTPTYSEIYLFNNITCSRFKFALLIYAMRDVGIHIFIFFQFNIRIRRKLRRNCELLDVVHDCCCRSY